MCNFENLRHQEIVPWGTQRDKVKHSKGKGSQPINEEDHTYYEDCNHRIVFSIQTDLLFYDRLCVIVLAKYYISQNHRKSPF